MKRGIETHTDYDPQGRWMLCIEKVRGKFTLDEIIEAAKEWEEDIYALVLKCLDGEWEETQGDYVELYRLSDLGKSGADWVQRGEDYYCSHCGGKASMDINRKHTVTTKFCSAEKSSLWAISRPKNGISLNGREYVCDENEKVKLYDNFNDAWIDLAFHGYDTGDMEREGIEIVEMQDCGDHYEPIVR